jgi:hypothetical protein
MAPAPCILLASRDRDYHTLVFSIDDEGLSLASVTLSRFMLSSDFATTFEMPVTEWIGNRFRERKRDFA